MKSDQQYLAKPSYVYWQYSGMPDLDKLGIDEVFKRHEIDRSEFENFAYTQEKAAFEDRVAGANADVKVYRHPIGLWFVKKAYGLGDKYPEEAVAGLAGDYPKHVESLLYSGIKARNLAESYNLRLGHISNRSFIEVDELFFPYGTALHWLVKRQNITEVVQSLVKDFLIPLLDADHPSLNESAYGNQFGKDASYAWFGCTLQNFAVLPCSQGPRLIYFDYFLPHVRNNDGTLKRYEAHHKTSDIEIHEYRYSTKPGLIHNLFRRNRYHLLQSHGSLESKEELWRMFIEAAEPLLRDYLERYFPGKSADDLTTTHFVTARGDFLRRKNMAARRETQKQATLEVLRKYSIPIKQWGRGAAKSVDNLVDEILEGETTLAAEGNEKKLLRNVDVVAVNVTYRDHAGSHYTLVEDKQLFSDGRSRKRHLDTTLGEKIRPDEDPLTAARRAVRLELGIEDRLDIKLVETHKIYRTSLSYPGLRTAYTKSVLTVELQPHQFKREGYTEQSGDFRPCFIWKRSRIPVGSSSNSRDLKPKPKTSSAGVSG